MKKFMYLMLTTISLTSYQISKAQCNGLKGPNLLGAKGTFSAPFITVNTTAESCASAGTNSYNPIGNVGNALAGCLTPGNLVPCSDYLYTDKSGGLRPEFRYTFLKILGDKNGTNCIRGINDWKGKDHTGDGGYFMVVNGARNVAFSPVFFQIKSIQVCAGTTYEFSAWVLNLQPGIGTDSTSPSISFKVNGVVVANSGLIASTRDASWVKVGGSFTATSNVVDLQVVNATFVPGGNDLGLDDISFNVCQSQIEVVRIGSTSNCSEGNFNTLFTVTDFSQNNSWYKWQLSSDGGTTFNDITSGARATFVGNSYSLNYNIGIVNLLMNGYKYRLVVSTSLEGLLKPECLYFNDYTVLVTDCGPLPVKLTSFTGNYVNGKSLLDWKTSQEINNDRYEILRSLDGETFTKIASVKGSANGNIINNYSYEDNTLSQITSNNIFYRLKQIDLDGKVTFSSVIKIILNSKFRFDIFPNPFNTNFTLSFAATNNFNGFVEIRNNAGTLMYKQFINIKKGNNSILMNNLPNLSSGIYFVLVNNAELSLKKKLQKM